MIEGMTLVVLLLLVGAVALTLLDVLTRNVVVGAALVLAAAVLSAALGANAPRVSVGGPQIHLTDAVSVLVVGAAVARYLRKRSINRLERLLILLGVLALFSLGRGFLVFDVEPAVNEFRRYLRFIGFMLYFASFGDDPDLRARMARVLLWGGAGMAALVALRWAALVGGINLGVLSASYDAPIRVVSGTETFFLAQVFLATLPVWQKQVHAPWLRRFSAFLGVFVIVLNRRTVWAALLVALCVVVLRNRQLGRRLAAVLLGGAVILAVILATASAEGDDQLAQSASSTGTLSWRIQGWSELFEAERSAGDWVVGQPFGASFERAVGEGRIVVSNPHSFYVETLLRLGLVGLAALAWMVACVWRGLYHGESRDDRLLNKQTLLFLLTAQMVWWITWDPGPEQGMIIGLALGAYSGMARPNLARHGSASSPRSARMARRAGTMPILSSHTVLPENGR